MKKYSDYEHASISMSKDSQFIAALTRLFSERTITHVFESGTFNGLGSTTTLAKTILSSKSKMEKFITLEVDQNFHSQAKRNLLSYSFITPVLGLSVSQSEALEFISKDAAILHHEKYPDIFIDNIEDPQGFYYNEIKGKLSQKTESWLGFLSFFRKPHLNEFVENAFDKFLPEFKGKSSLILLDSAGGLGFFEFQKVSQLLADESYCLILDDIHHLKHFRSYETIKMDARFSILDINLDHGWLIAEHYGNNSSTKSS